jgi:protein SCO1/2
MSITTNHPVTNNFRQRDIILAALTVVLVFVLIPITNQLLKKENDATLNLMAPQFDLFDTQGNTVSLSDYRGQFVYLMFGFLRCSDICHTQVQYLESISSRLDRPDTHFLYLAMDSVSDKPSALSAYFDQRDPKFTSLRADSIRQMQFIADSFNVKYRLKGNPGSDSYVIEHPARIFFIGPKGLIKAVYTGRAFDVDKVVDDFLHLSTT